MVPESRARWHPTRFRIVIPAFPAFNIYSSIARLTTALGPVSVATVVNRMDGWEAEVIDENNYRRGPRDAAGRPDYEALERLRPARFVGFYGGLTSTIPRLYELAAWFKRRGIITMAGGQHFIDDNIEEGLANGLDYVILGEGEMTIRHLLHVLEEGGDPASVPGLAFRRNGTVIRTPVREPIVDFSRIPCPDFSLVRYAKLSLYPVSWVRGCGMNCEFCTVKGRVRCPDAGYAFHQIVHHVERCGARQFFLVDDLFGQHRHESLRLCEMLRGYQEQMHVKLDLTVQVRLDMARDSTLLHAMREAGVNTVAIGFESPIPAELAAMNKKLDPENMLAQTRVFHKAGFFVHGMFIFGYPMPDGVTWSMPAAERVKIFRSFIRRARIDTVQVLLPVPLPGTEMTRRLAAQNRIYPRSHIGWEYYDGNFPVFQPDPPLTPEQMQNSTRMIMGRFYRFKSMFSIGLHVLAFPTVLLSLHSFRRGFQRWYRQWRNSLLRFTGWLILHKWTLEFHKSRFLQRLESATRSLSDASPRIPRA